MKLASWKGKLLSMAGKIQLVKSCLQNVPIYYLSLFKLPCVVAEKMKGYKKGSFAPIWKKKVDSPWSLRTKCADLGIVEDWELERLKYLIRHLLLR